MSNPLTLQELADSLTASLRDAHHRQDAAPSAGDGAYQAGYAAALADTRATVLAMIVDINRRIANNNRVVPGIDAAGATGEVYQAILDGRIEAYEDVRGETDEHKANPGKFPTGTLPTECVECGKAIKHLPTGWVHEATGMTVFRRVTGSAVSPVEECPEIDGPHKANAEGRCVHCGEVVGL